MHALQLSWLHAASSAPQSQAAAPAQPPSRGGGITSSPAAAMGWGQQPPAGGPTPAVFDDALGACDGRGWGAIMSLPSPTVWKGITRIHGAGPQGDATVTRTKYPRASHPRSRAELTRHAVAALKERDAAAAAAFLRRAFELVEKRS